LKKDWQVSIQIHYKSNRQDAGTKNSSIQATTKSIHEESVRIVADQIAEVGTQLQALDTFVVRATSQNNAHHMNHHAAINGLSARVQASINSVTTDLSTASSQRLAEFRGSIDTVTGELSALANSFESDAQSTLTELRTAIGSANLVEYEPTGATPQKTEYSYPTRLPRTSIPETEPVPAKMVYTDNNADVVPLVVVPTQPSLRELDPNMVVDTMPVVGAFKRSFSTRPTFKSGRENKAPTRRLRNSPPQ
jgi:hypothetical protein